MTRDKNHPALSVVVVTYDMARELPRTLRSLAPGYQRGIERRRLRGDRRRQRLARADRSGVLDRFPGQLRHVRDRPRPAGAGARRQPRRRDGERRLRRAAHRRRAHREPRAARAALLAAPARRATDRRDARVASRHRRGTWTRPTPATTRPPRTRCSPSSTGSATATGSSPSARSPASSARGWFRPMGESNGLFMPAHAVGRARRARRSVRAAGRRALEPRPVPPRVRARRRAARRAARRGNVPPDPRRRGDVGPVRLGRDARRVRHATWPPIPPRPKRAPLLRRDSPDHIAK